MKAFDLPEKDDDISSSTSFLGVGENLKSNVEANNAAATNVVKEDSTHSISTSTTEVDSAGVVSSATKNVVEAHDRKRNREASLEKGVVKLTLNLKEGLLYFIEYDFVTCD